MENITSAQKNKMAMTYGLLIGIIYIVITSAVNLTVSNMINFYLTKFVGYVAYFIIIGYYATRIKKANGGYIEFREVFGAVFIMIIIAGFMSYLYNYLYMYVIDPHYMEKIKTAVVHFMEKMKAPDEKIDETVRKFDSQMEEAKHFSFKNNILAIVGFIIMDSLFGLIVSAIVKKSRPLFNN